MNQLAAFALVAEEYEKTGDAILGMAPLFDTVIAERAGQPFEPAWFASRFAELFGRAMSQTIAQALCERLEEAKLLERHQLTDGSYVLLCSPKGRANSSLTENHILEIAETFVEFSAGLLEKLGHQKSKQSLASDFLQRIAKPEFTSIFLVPERKVRFSRVLSLKGTERPAREWSLNQAVDYLVADFVLKLSESEGDSFDRLASIAYGALLADAVSALAEPPRAKSEDSLRVVIDGPILLDALNLNTESNREYAIGLIDLFKSSGLMLVTFDHVIDEMQRLIERTLENYTKGDAFGPLAARLRSTRGHALYARTVASSLQMHVKDLGVTTLFSGKYLEPPHINFFSVVEEDLLRNALGEVHENLGPRIVDARSIATVIRLKRDNQRPSSALDSGTVFLTRNSALVRRTESYLVRGQSEPRPRFTIMSDGQLASLLWFHNGSSGSHLSKQRLIANCANAALTRLDVVARMTETLDRLGGDHRAQFEMLMRDKRASLCPMRLTAGYANAITEDNAIAVLDEMRRVVATPFIDQVRSDAESRLGEVHLRLQSAEANANRLRADYDRERDSNNRQVERLASDNASVTSLARSADLSRAQTELKLEQVTSEKRNLEKSQQNERERSVKVLSAAQEKISSAETKTEGRLKAVVGITYVVIIVVALIPDFATSRIVVAAVAVLSLAGFFTFTPTIEKWLIGAAKRWHRSERRQLVEMAQSLGLGELVE